MANDIQKRSLLDQLTDTATQAPALPSTLAPATSDDDSTSIPSLLSAPATTTGSTANLESLAASPDTMAGRVAATSASKDEEHPGFLKTLGRLAGGATGLTDPNSSPEAGTGAKIMSLVGRTGNALAAAAGTPEEKQLAEERTQLPLKMAQIQNEMDYRRATTANAANKTNLQYGTGANGTPEGTSRMTAEANQQNAASKEGLNEARQKQIEASLNGQVHVMPEIAHAIGRPELADTNMSPIQYQQQVANVLKSLGVKSMDLGAEGTWGTSPLTGRIAKISDSSPSQMANSRYMNRPVQALNPATGRIEWMRGGDAVAAGAAPAAQGAQIMSKEAQFKDIYSGIANMRHAVAGISQEPLDLGTISKLTLATRETDPTISQQTFDTVLGTQNLTPAQQDFVISVQQLNERALSLRNLAGMGNGSDQMRAAIRATLPNAKSGSPQMMLKQLDAVTNLVDNLYTGVPRVNTGNGPSKTPNAAPGARSGENSTNSGGNPPSSGKVTSFADWKKNKPQTGAR